MYQWLVVTLLLLVGFLHLGGCTTVVGKLPTVRAWPDMSAFQNKPSVYFALPEEPPQGFKGALESVAQESSLFRSFSFDPAQAEEADYTIEIGISRRDEEPDVSPIWGYLSALTWLGTPAPLRQTAFTVTAEVKDRQSGLVKSYTVEESTRDWVGYMMWPLLPFTLIETQTRLWTNVVRTLFLKMLEDDILRYSSLDSAHAMLAPSNGRQCARV